MTGNQTEFQIKTSFPVPPQKIYDLWLDSVGHSEMTGGGAECSSADGGEFSAWEGYISGKNVELKEPNLIKQSWRTSEFKDSDPDSEIQIDLKEIPEGTEFTLTHKGIPPGQPNYEQGWWDFYLNPMSDYFSPQ